MIGPWTQRHDGRRSPSPLAAAEERPPLQVVNDISTPRKLQVGHVVYMAHACGGEDEPLGEVHPAPPRQAPPPSCSSRRIGLSLTASGRAGSTAAAPLPPLPILRGRDYRGWYCAPSMRCLTQTEGAPVRKKPGFLGCAKSQLREHLPAGTKLPLTAHYSQEPYQYGPNKADWCANASLSRCMQTDTDSCDCSRLFRTVPVQPVGAPGVDPAARLLLLRRERSRARVSTLSISFWTARRGL